MSTQKPGTLPLIESQGVWMKIRLLPSEHAHALTDRGGELSELCARHWSSAGHESRGPGCRVRVGGHAGTTPIRGMRRPLDHVVFPRGRTGTHLYGWEGSSEAARSAQAHVERA